MKKETRIKTVFEIERIDQSKMLPEHGGHLEIIGSKPEYRPYIKIRPVSGPDLYIKDKDLELLAVNILKSLKSKKLTKGKQQ